MIVISEADLAVVCDNGKCTGTAVYIIVVQAHESLVRLYCPECTRQLTEGVAKIMRDNESESVHDVLAVDYLMTGQEIVNA